MSHRKPTKFPQLLRIVRGNAKLSKTIGIFSLPSGHTCPGAHTCLSKADRLSGRLTDGKHLQFRCYSASQEATFKSLRLQRWRNFEMLRQAATTERMAELIIKSVKSVNPIYFVRIHGGGDFYNQAYFDAWMLAAGELPLLKFYAYTKSLKFWERRIIDPDPGLPRNLKLVASRGGKFDELIDRYDLPSVLVVKHPEEAIAMDLEIDHDDSHAIRGESKFALLLHGSQPVGSKASAALKRMRQDGIAYSYSS